MNSILQFLKYPIEVQLQISKDLEASKNMGKCGRSNKN